MSQTFPQSTERIDEIVPKIQSKKDTLKMTQSTKMERPDCSEAKTAMFATKGPRIHVENARHAPRKLITRSKLGKTMAVMSTKPESTRPVSYTHLTLPTKA